mmetsp:Transcript_2321/g.6836  ORF Transcript_2321/g.6836 Transcript_2321/m.6836 type:complete len:381 (+) Transcript_2321:198-1340(+)
MHHGVVHNLGVAGSEEATAGKEVPPLLPGLLAGPGLAVLLGPLDHLANHTGGVVALAALADGRFGILAAGARLGLGVAGLDDRPRDLAEQGGVRGHEGLAVSVWWDHVGANRSHLLSEEVVEDAITAYDHEVPFVDRDAVYSAAPLNDLICDPLIEVRINSVIYAAELQGALTMAVDALHLRPEAHAKLACDVVLPEDENLTITYGEHRNHGVQFAVDACAVVQDGEGHGRGAHALRGVVGLSHQRNRSTVRPTQPATLVWNQLGIRHALASLQELVRQLRGVNAKLFHLRDAVRNAQYHGRDDRGVRIAVARLRLLRMSLLVSSSTEAQGLVFVVLLRQVLLPPLEVVQVLALARGAHEESGGAAKCTFHHRYAFGTGM